jgi:hypothetical protein
VDVGDVIDGAIGELPPQPTANSAATATAIIFIMYFSPWPLRPDPAGAKWPFRY